MKSVVFALASMFLVCSSSYAASPFEQLRNLFNQAKVVDLTSLPANSTKTFRGNCHEIQSPEDAPNPKAMVFVLKTIDYPADGPVLGKRVVYGYVTDGAKSDTAAIDELEEGIQRVNYFGFLQIDRNTHSNPGGHTVAANFEGCMNRLTKIPCRNGYVKKDDKYFYFSVGFRSDSTYPGGGFAYEYSNRLYCYADAAGF